MTTPDYAKILGRAILLCWAVIIGCLLVSFARPDLFLIVVDNPRVIAAGAWIERTPVALYLFALLSSTVSMLPYWLACIGRKWFAKRWHVWAVAGVLAASTAVKLLFPVVGFWIDVAFVFTSFPVLLGARVSDTSYALFAVGAYQLFTGFTRGAAITPTFNLTLLSNSVIYLDVLVFTILMFLYSVSGGLKYGILNGLISWRRSGRIALDACEKAARTCADALTRIIGKADGRNRRNRTRVEKTRRRIVREMRLRKIGSYALIFSFIALTAYFCYRWMELLIVFPSYLAIRWLYPKTFDTTPGLCLFASVVTFPFLLAVSAPVGILINSGIVIAVCFTYLLWRAADYKDLLQGSVGRERDLRDLCAARGLSLMLTDIAVDYRLNGLTVKEQMEKTGLAQSTVKNYRTEINKILD